MTKRFKSALALLMMVFLSGTAFAQSSMTFYDTTGQAKESWLLQDVGKVTFDGGNIVVTHFDGTYTTAINEVLSIKFTDVDNQDPTSIEKISQDKAQLRIVTGEQSIRVLGADSGAVTIWSVTGQQIYNNRHWNGEEINIAHLERGIYIISINSTTFKFNK